MRAVNLIPAEQRGGASVGAGRSGGGAYAVLGVLGAIALLAVLYGIADHQISSRKSEVASLQQRASRAQSEAAQLAPYASFVALRQARVSAVESLVDSRFDWAHAFHEFGRVLPHSASMTSLSGTIGSATPTTATTPAATAASGSVSSATPPGSVPVFTITGCATSQSAVAETINDLRLIDGVSTVTLQSSVKSATSSGSSSSSVGCNKSATYTLAVGFQPLPATAAAAAAASTRTVAATTGGVK